jgi:acyl carrier protein
MGRCNPQGQGAWADGVGRKTAAPHRRAFLGQTAAALLAAVAATAPANPAVALTAPAGTTSDKPPQKKPDQKEPTIEDRVCDLAARRFKLDRKKVTRDTSIDRHLKNDWTGYLRFMEDVQGEFKLKISLKTFRTFSTLGQVADYIDKATRKGKEPEKKPRAPGPVRE